MHINQKQHSFAPREYFTCDRSLYRTYKIYTLIGRPKSDESKASENKGNISFYI